jgi:hypothetical protein
MDVHQPTGSFGVTSTISKNPQVGMAVSTLVGLGVVIIAGGLYMEWYKGNELRKVYSAYNHEIHA